MPVREERAAEARVLPVVRGAGMAETAAHLVDYVIPRVLVRQWVLSFPIPLRILLAAHPQLVSAIAPRKAG